MPTVASMIFQKTKRQSEDTATPTITMPMACLINNPAPPPKNRPLPVVLG